MRKHRKVKESAGEATSVPEDRGKAQGKKLSRRPNVDVTARGHSYIHRDSRVESGCRKEEREDGKRNWEFTKGGLLQMARRRLCKERWAEKGDG